MTSFLNYPTRAFGSLSDGAGGVMRDGTNPRRFAGRRTVTLEKDGRFSPAIKCSPTTLPAPFTLSVGCASLTRSNGLRTAFERHSRLARAVRIDTRGRGVELQFSRANHAAKHVARQLSNASKASVRLPPRHEVKQTTERFPNDGKPTARCAKTTA